MPGDHVEWDERIGQKRWLSLYIPSIFPASLKVVSDLVHLLQLLLVKRVIGLRPDQHDDAIPREVMKEMSVVKK